MIIAREGTEKDIKTHRLLGSSSLGVWGSTTPTCCTTIAFRTAPDSSRLPAAVAAVAAAEDLPVQVC